MRLLTTFFSLATLGYGLYWVADKNPELKQKAEELLHFRTTSALETRYRASQVMDSHQKSLLKEKGARFLDPELRFYPYLLMEVKFSNQNRTKEGLVLWDLTDGEMVLDTKTWEKTHGFADCLNTSAQSHEFQILSYLSAQGGASDVESLEQHMHLERPLLEVMLQGCLRKNLIISNGANHYRVHLDSPKWTSSPETKLYEPLTTRPHKGAIRACRHFSKAQVERMAKLAFGESFSIRTSTEIYLPIHRIVVENPDGSIHTSHFNALSGNELPAAPFYQ